ncbi:ketosteroid isomerase [Pseudomonas aeruginosa]|nr:ketosteroid isomerase [Pseudomonas aeruginosa]
MAHPNAELIERFYQAFQRLDGEAMAACYAPQATFHDPAFGELRGREVGDMWRPADSRARDFRLDYANVPRRRERGACAMGGPLPVHPDRAQGGESHRGPFPLRRRFDRRAPRPVRPMALEPPGAWRQGPAAGLGAAGAAGRSAGRRPRAWPPTRLPIRRPAEAVGGRSADNLLSSPADNPQDAAMITLFQFPAAFNVPNASPYCLKLETWFAPGRPGVSGEGRQRPAQGAQGQAALPCVSRARRSVTARSSSYPRRALRGHSRRRAGCPGQGLGPRAITRLCDEHLYYLMLYFRWFDEDSWRVLKPVVLRLAAIRRARRGGLGHAPQGPRYPQGAGTRGPRQGRTAGLRPRRPRCPRRPAWPGPVLRRRTSVQRRCRRLRYPRQPHRGDPGYPTQPCGARLSAPGGVLRADAGAGLE